MRLQRVAYLISSLAETRDRAFSREVESMSCLPVALLTNGVSIVTQVGFEFTTPALLVRKLNHHTTASPWRGYHQESRSFVTTLKMKLSKYILPSMPTKDAIHCQFFAAF